MEQKFRPEKKKNTGMAIVAYILFFVPLLTEAKNDPFVKYHVKQGLALFILCIISGLVWWVPVIGQIVSLIAFVLWIIGIINAANGQEKPLPLIGQFGEKFNI